MKFSFRSTTFALVVLSASPVAAASLSESERSGMQAAMTQHIDRFTIEGMFLSVDLKSGEVQKFSPSKSRPIITRMSESFVLCSDFKDSQRHSATVDFYVGKRFPIFQTEVNNRKPLMELERAGKVASAE